MLFFSSALILSAFSSGNRVQCTQNLNVRTTYSTSASVITTEASGSLGTVAVGPQSGSGYTWYYINWDNGYSGWSAQDFLQQVVAAVPAAPTLLSPGTSSSPGPTISTLTPTMLWNAVSGATNYAVYVRDVSTGSTVYSNTGVGNTTALVISALTAGHSYQWYMQATNGSGASAYSSSYYFVEQAAAVPAAPTLLSPGTSSSPGPTISTLTPTMLWNSVSGATNYAVYVRDVSTGSTVYSNTGVGNTTALVIPALTAGHSYQWYMQATNGNGASAYSSSYYFVEQAAAVPAAPTLLSPGTSSSPGPTISTLTPTMLWNAVSGATNYAVYVRDVNTGSTVYSNTGVGNTTALVIPALTAGHSYQWFMQATNGNGASAYSSSYYFVEQAAAGPAAPTLLSPGTSSSPGPTISTLTPTMLWNAVSGANNYAVYVRDVNTGSTVYSNTTVGNTTALVIPALTTGHSYQWFMQATNSNGASAYSSSYYFVEQGTGPVISSLNPTSMVGSTSSQTLQVNGSNFTSGAKVQVAYASNGYTFVNTNANATWVSSLLLSVPITTSTTADTWKVRVQNPDGQISGSLNLTVTSGPPPPSVGTLGATSVTTNSAILNGSVNPNGSSTMAYFEYGTSSSYGSTTPQQNLGTTSQNMQFSVSGLSPNVTYHYHIVATSNGGTSPGQDAYFRTSSVPTPTVQTLLPTNITNSGTNSTNVTLNGSANPNGGDTMVHFDYGPTTSYGTSTTPQDKGSGSSTVNFNAAIAVTALNQQFHYRAVAVSGGQTYVGLDQTFTSRPDLKSLAIFSDMAYGTPHSDAPNNYQLAYDSNNMPGGNPNHGFRAIAYRTMDNTQVIIAYRGTYLNWKDPTTYVTFWKDVIGDVSFKTGIPSLDLQEDLQSAAAFARSVVGQVSQPSAVTFTGHSLGAALAQVMGQAWQQTTAGFNAPGAGGALYNALSPLAGTSPVVLNPNYSNINYRIDGDQVSLSGKAMGTGSNIVWLEPAGGMITEYGDSALDVILNFAAILKNHEMSTVFSQLNQAIPSAIQPNLTQAINQEIIAGSSIFPDPLHAILDFTVVAAIVTDPVAALFDPPSGTNYIFTETAGSPLLSSISLPTLPGIQSYKVSFQLNGVWSAFQNVSAGNTVPFAAPVSGVNFIGLDVGGNTVDLPDFVFGTTFASAGTVNASLTESLFSPVNVATLSGLTMGSGLSLGPAFSAGTISYSAYPNTVASSISVAPTATDPNATVTVNGIAVASGGTSAPVNLNMGGNTITVVVTAEDGSTTDTYTVAVTRAFVATAPATFVSSSGATFNGSAIPNGQSSNAYFQYGTTAGYGLTSATFGIGSGNSAAPVSFNAYGLAKGATYHYQLVMNSGGTLYYGGDEVFTTPAATSPANWHSAQITGLTNPSLANMADGARTGVAQPNANLYFYKGTDNNIWAVFLAGNTWGQQQLTTLANVADWLAYDPNFSTLNYQGTDGNLWCVYYDSKAAKWTSQQLGAPPQGVTVAGDIVVDTYGGWNNIYYRGSDSNLYAAYFNGSAWVHVAIGGTATVKGNLAIQGNNHLVYYQGTDNNLWCFYYNGKAWTQLQLSTTANVAGTVAVDNVGFTVYYKSNVDNSAWCGYSAGGPWTALQLDTTANLSASATSFSNIAPYPINDCTVYLDANGQCESLYFNGSQWTHAVLGDGGSQITGGLSLQPVNHWLFARRSDGSVILFYID